LLAARAAVCGARAAFLRRGGGRPAAAALWLAQSGDPAAVGALCQVTFAAAAAALQALLRGLGSGGSSSGGAGSSGANVAAELEALAVQAAAVSAVAAALELAWDEADDDDEEADDDDDGDDGGGGASGWSVSVGRGGFGGGDDLASATRDWELLGAYRNLLELLAPLLAAQSLAQGLARSGDGRATAAAAEAEAWAALADCCAALDACVRRAPLACAAHLLAVAAHLLNRADHFGGGTGTGSASGTPFGGAALERLLALQHAAALARGGELSDAKDAVRLTAALATHLALAFARPPNARAVGAGRHGHDARGGPSGGGGPAGSGLGAGAARGGSQGRNGGLTIAPRSQEDWVPGLGAGWGQRRSSGQGEGGWSEGAAAEGLAVFAQGAEDLLEMPPLY
jgi:hypothetical protein